MRLVADFGETALAIPHMMYTCSTKRNAPKYVFSNTRSAVTRLCIPARSPTGNQLVFPLTLAPVRHYITCMRLLYIPTATSTYNITPKFGYRQQLFVQQ